MERVTIFTWFFNVFYVYITVMPRLAQERDNHSSTKRVDRLRSAAQRFPDKLLVERSKDKRDFRDRKFLREILLSGGDIDFTELGRTKFKTLKFDHPLFRGNGDTLIRRWFGRYGPLKEDYKQFIWYVLEDEMIKRDKRNTTEQIKDATVGTGEHTRDLAENLGFKDWLEDLPTLLGTLSPVEAQSIIYHFGLQGEDKLTLAEIGARYNISRERIRQIVYNGIDKLRLNIRDLYPSDLEEVQTYGLPVEGKQYLPPLSALRKPPNEIPVDIVRDALFPGVRSWFDKAFNKRLQDKGIHTLEDLTKYTREDILRLKPSHKHKVMHLLCHLESELQKCGLRFKKEDEKKKKKNKKKLETRKKALEDELETLGEIYGIPNLEDQSARLKGLGRMLEDVSEIEDEESRNEKVRLFLEVLSYKKDDIRAFMLEMISNRENKIGKIEKQLEVEELALNLD